MKKVRQIALSATLAGLFLSAGAFAKPDITQAPQVSQTNVTVIYKSSGMKLTAQDDSCKTEDCVNA